MLIFHRLYDSYEECDSDVGVQLYDEYVTLCLRDSVKPLGANIIGKLVNHCFPNVTSTRTRNQIDKQKFCRSYMGLRRREMHEDPTELSWRDIINRGLPKSGFTVEQTGNNFHISYISAAVCNNIPVVYHIHITSDLEVSLIVLDRNIALHDYLIWTKLSILSSDKINALLKSILSLQLCFGDVCKDGNPQKCSIIKRWNSKSHVANQHSEKCKVFVAVPTTVDKCSKCYRAFAKTKSAQNSTAKDVPKTCEAIDADPKITKLADSMQPLDIPDPCTPINKGQKLSYDNTPSPIPSKSFYSKPQTCDASVGTTPIKSTKQVLLKFFPYLQEKPLLLALVSDQVDMAQHKDARGRRYDKQIVSLALTLWTRSPKNYEELRKSGFLLPSSKTLSLYKNWVEQKPGLNLDMMRWMANEAKSKNLSKNGYVGGLVLDEMNVQKSLDISNKRGE